ncbi:MAG: phage tail tube protein [Pseudomonadota bacterium]
MALPVTGTRGDIVVQVEFDPVGAAGTYTNACGVTSASFEISNDIISFDVGDCDDWSASVQKVKNYGAQDVTMSIDATWSAAQHVQMIDWASRNINEGQLNLRLLYPNATTGQVSMIDGLALMETLTLDNVGNVEGNPQTENISLQFSGGITVTKAS